MTHLQSLASRIEKNDAKVCILGLGYVGLPLLVAFHDAGLPVLGFDVDPEKPELLKQGINYLPHLGGDLCKPLQNSPRFEAFSDPSRLQEADVHIICVPTPLGVHDEPDLSYVINTAELIGKSFRPGQLVILESTTYPGTTREELLPALVAAAVGAGREVPTMGENLFVAFSPEREDPGRKSHNTKSIPKLVGGLDPASTDLATTLYRKAIAQVHPVRSAEVAEAAKLMENIFRAVNIALANEMKVVLDALGINVWEVVDAAATKPFGFMPFYPGPGLGGHCIPIDPFYLSWKAREVGVSARFIELAGQVNTSMPAYVISRLTEALNRAGKAVSRSRVLVLGLSYKPDIADTRESPSFELIEHLLEMGAAVDYADPHVPKTKPMRKYDLGMESVKLTPDSIARYDCVLISTNHGTFDYGMIAQHAQLVVDTRNAMREFEGQMGARLVRA